MVETWRIHAPMRIDISVYMYSFIYTLICMYVHLQVILYVLSRLLATSEGFNLPKS